MINDALKEFHDHKDSIISAGVQTEKGSRIIDNWHIHKLEFLQSVTTSIRNNGVPIQWSADHTEHCHITEVKDPSRSGNGQDYESQICRYLNRAEKCWQFDLATAIHEAHVKNKVEDGDGDDEVSDRDDEGLNTADHTCIQLAAHPSQAIQHTNYVWAACVIEER